MLCLHGFSTNSILLKNKNNFSRINKTLEYFYIDGSVTLPNDMKAWWIYNKEDPLDINWDELSNIEDIDKLIGFNDSVSLVIKAIQENPSIETIFGFSQGGAMLSLLVHFKLLPQQIKRVIFVGAFFPLKCELNIHTIPSLHIAGLEDSVINHSLSEKLASQYLNPVIIIHKGKHVIPNDKNMRDTFRNFLNYSNTYLM